MCPTALRIPLRRFIFLTVVVAAATLGSAGAGQSGGPAVTRFTYGGDGIDTVHAVTTDDSGNIYIVGRTTSKNLPGTERGYQKTLRGYAPFSLLFLDVLGIILFYELISRYTRGLFLPFYLSLLTIVAFDNLIFTAMVHAGRPNVMTLLYSGFAGKAIKAFFYSVVSWAYLRYAEPRTAVVGTGAGLPGAEELHAVRHDLDPRLGVAVLADPARLAQASHDHDRAPLLQELRAELREPAPHAHLDEAHDLARLAALLLHLPVHRQRHPQVGNAAGIGVLELRIAREATHHDGQAVIVHALFPRRPRTASAIAPDIARGVPAGR